MFFEKVKSDILAHNSYVVEADGEMAVIDPRRDCLVYTTLAEARGANVTKIFETHKNEDYVSGSREACPPDQGGDLSWSAGGFWVRHRCEGGRDVQPRTDRT
ncbi:MAG: hypothetical protein RQM90_10775 [Methanoculleus sp.]